MKQRFRISIRVRSVNSALTEPGTPQESADWPAELSAAKPPLVHHGPERIHRFRSTLSQPPPYRREKNLRATELFLLSPRNCRELDPNSRIDCAGLLDLELNGAAVCRMKPVVRDDEPRSIIELKNALDYESEILHSLLCRFENQRVRPGKSLVLVNDGVPEHLRCQAEHGRNAHDEKALAVWRRRGWLWRRWWWLRGVANGHLGELDWLRCHPDDELHMRAGRN